MKSIIFCFLLFCLSLQTFAQEKIFVIHENTKKQGAGFIINNFTYFYADSSNQLRFEDISKPEFFSKMKLYDWQNRTTQRLNLNYWYKTTIINQGHLQTNFTYEPSSLGENDFYIISKKGVQKKKNGQDIPLKDRTWHINPNAILIELPLNDTLTIFTRASSANEMKVAKDIWLGEVIPYYESYIYDNFPQVFFQGAILIMFFYNLLLFVMVKDRAYLFYTLYMLSVSLYFVHQFLPNYSLTAIYPLLINFFHVEALFITFLYVLFIRYFLNIPKIAPKTDKYLSHWTVGRTLIIPLFYMIGAIFPIFTDRHIGDLFQMVLILDLLLGMVLIQKSWKKNYKLTLFMIFGFLALASPIILSSTSVLGINLGFDMFEIQIGILLEIILFSLGLGYRSNLSEKEKLQAQKDFILELEKNELLVKEQNTVLEKKVGERTQEIQTQKQLIEQKNESMLASITYAQRIQQAILPLEEQINRLFPKNFIFFKPKDIISGDFYYLQEKDGIGIIAAIDCTGHGVPGALMTMLAAETLNEIIQNKGVVLADQILNELHKNIRKTLKQAETKNKDGMDMSLLAVNKQEKRASFAGAKNPICYIKKQELFYLKADKTSIGGDQKEEKRIFTAQSIFLDCPTTFYLFTDGFQDQFGGKEKRKFTIAQLKTLFLEIHEKEMSEQHRILEQSLQSWMREGKEKQIDDVLIIGLLL